MAQPQLTQRKKLLWPIVAVLLIVQAALSLSIVHRESLTFDEDDHMFAGYMMWKTGDYGLNPEHPPLVKLLATLPVLSRVMWVPPLQHRNFKEEAYLDGRDWLARNDGAAEHLVFQMRAAAELLAIGLCLAIFLAARAWFGDTAGLIALTLAVFDPNILANSALVTTDVGVSCFFVAAVYTFSRYASQPTLLRLCVAGACTGLLLATKHSGILLAPMLVCLVLWEVGLAERSQRKLVSLRLIGGVVGLTLIAVLVLWSFYGFRYAARPNGLALSVTLSSYVRPLTGFDSHVVLAVARLHLLPESYLMGLVDVKRMAASYPTFLLGTVYPHGVLPYFPLVILIKTTLGLLALGALGFLVCLRAQSGRRGIVYTLVPSTIYLLIAMAAGMDIGSRHLLPMYAFLFIFIGGMTAVLIRKSRFWTYAAAILILGHIASSLAVYPNELAYANEAWGGPENLHNLLSDANVDWAQQLFQVKAWQDRHPSEECWFAYFARPEVDPATYGIRCHALPSLDTQWLGGAESVPPIVKGAVLISAGDLSGCEWPSGKLNPYRAFQHVRADESIDHSVFVYRGVFSVREASAMASAQLSKALLAEHQPQAAYQVANQGVAASPDSLYAQTAAGDAAMAVGDVRGATRAWTAALHLATALEPDAQPGFVPSLQRKLAASSK